MCQLRYRPVKETQVIKLRDKEDDNVQPLSSWFIDWRVDQTSKGATVSHHALPDCLIIAYFIPHWFI